MKLLTCLLALASLAPVSLRSASAPSAAAPAKADGFTFVKSAGDISEYTLDSNKLTVLLKEDHSAPVLTFMVTYRVGSRNEVIGTTGATHLLEHLMFKGSKKYNRDIGTGFDTLLDKIGATNNASTWLDRTNYYEELASDKLELALQLESDRMRDLLLREKDRQPEMTVVRNEYERGENDPIEALDKMIWAAAYIAHPYHHSTIGWKSDIEKVPIEKLQEFYHTFYWPNNATVSIIGDFQPTAALALVRKYYSPIKASPTPLPEVYTEEPPQQGQRRVIVKRPGEIGVVGVAYKSPAGTSPDYPAMAILGDILTDGKTSRLYRALTDKNLTLDVSVQTGFFRDPSLQIFYAALNPPDAAAPGAAPAVGSAEAGHRNVEEILVAEIEKLKKDGVTPEEVARAISKETASTAYGRDGTFSIARELNEEIAVGDWTEFVSLPEAIKRVTAADVLRVARAYLVEDQSTIGYFIPQAEAPAGAPAAGPAAPARRSPSTGARDIHGPAYYQDPEVAGSASDPASVTSALRLPSSVNRPLAASANPGGQPAAGAAETGAALIAPKVNRRKVAGIDVLTLHTSLKDVVTITGSFPAGDAFNPPGRSAIADLTTGMLDKGTTAHDKFALAQQLEDVGASIDFSSGAITLAFNAKALKKDLPLVMKLLAEQLRTPAFSPEEFEKLKKQLIGEFQQSLEQPNVRANIALSRAIYPEGHPNRAPDVQAYLADLAKTTLDEVRAFHAANYGPANMTFVAVGDVDDVVIDQQLGAAFEGWRGGKAAPTATRAPAITTGRTERVVIPGKTSVSLYQGFPSGLKYSDADRLALDLGSQVFGGGYFSSRLLATVRNEEGLTYGIGAGLSADTYVDGQWMIRGTFAPELLAKGIESTTRQLKKFAATGVTADELRDFKAAVIGTYKLSLATSTGMANQLLLNVQRGMPLSQVDDYPAKVNALTLDQVNAAIKKYLDPDKMVTVLSGTLPAGQ